jgi:hypothetical protein
MEGFKATMADPLHHREGPAGMVRDNPKVWRGLEQFFGLQRVLGERAERIPGAGDREVFPIYPQYYPRNLSPRFAFATLCILRTY